MNKKRIAATAFALACTAPLLAAEAPGYYAGGHLGVNDIGDWSADVNFGGPSTPASLKLDNGEHYGLFVGRRTEHARFEVEWQAGEAKITGVTLGPVSQAGSGHAKYQALTLNAYRTFELSDRVTAYAGLGAGWGRTQLPRQAPLGTCNCFQEASHSGLLWQARLGADWQLAERQFLFAQYTLLHLPAASANATPSVNYGSKNVNVVSVGYRAGF